jgi:hypothetical protein
MLFVCALHFYDGDGFGIEFHVEALDGTVVPAGFANQEEEDDDINPKKDTDGTSETEKDEKDKPTPSDAPSDKPEGEQQKGSSGTEEMVEVLDMDDSVERRGDTLLGVFAITDGSKSVPSKRWYHMVKEDEAVAAKSAPSKVGCVPLGWSDNSTQTSSFSLPQQVPEDVNGSVRSGTEVSDFPMSSLCCKAAVQDSSVTDHSDFGQPIVNKEGMGDIPQSSLPIEANCMGDLMSPNLKFSTNFAHSSPHFCSPPVSVSPSPPQGRNGLTPIVLRSPPMNTPKDNVTTRGTGVFLGGRYSQKEVIAYGGISEGGIFGVRTSERVRAQPNADETQLKRAQLIAQAKEDILY